MFVWFVPAELSLDIRWPLHICFISPSLYISPFVTVFSMLPSAGSGCWRKLWMANEPRIRRLSLRACKSAHVRRCWRILWRIWRITPKPDRSRNRTDGVHGDPSVRTRACYEWQLVAVCDSMCRIVCKSCTLFPFLLLSFSSILKKYISFLQIKTITGIQLNYSQMCYIEATAKISLLIIITVSLCKICHFEELINWKMKTVLHTIQ